MLSNRNKPPLCQVSMFNTSPISRKCDITVRTCKLLRHIIALEEIDRNCLQLSYALFVGLIHNSLTFSERDVATALSYRDKNHFGASVSRKTNFKSSIWKWQRRHFRKLLEIARFSLRDVTMAKIVGTNKLGNLRTTTKFTTTTSVDWERTGTRTSVSAGKRKLKMKSIGRSTTTTPNVNKHVEVVQL